MKRVLSKTFSVRGYVKPTMKNSMFTRVKPFSGVKSFSGVLDSTGIFFGGLDFILRVMRVISCLVVC